MPKTRRAGRKTQLRRVIAQLYAPPPLDHDLGIEDSVQPVPVITENDDRDNLATKYRLIPVTVEIVRLAADSIPQSDPRYFRYTQQDRILTVERNQGK